MAYQKLFAFRFFFSPASRFSFHFFSLPAERVCVCVFAMFFFPLLFLFSLSLCCHALCVQRKRANEHTGAHTFHILQIIYDILKRTSPFFRFARVFVVVALLLRAHSLRNNWCLLPKNILRYNISCVCFFSSSSSSTSSYTVSRSLQQNVFWFSYRVCERARARALAHIFIFPLHI